MSESIEQKERARRNVWLALIHLALALAFVGVFVWKISTR